MCIGRTRNRKLLCSDNSEHVNGVRVRFIASMSHQAAKCHPGLSTTLSTCLEKRNKMSTGLLSTVKARGPRVHLAMTHLGRSRYCTQCQWTQRYWLRIDWYSVDWQAFDLQGPISNQLVSDYDSLTRICNEAIDECRAESVGPTFLVSSTRYTAFIAHSLWLQLIGDSHVIRQDRKSTLRRYVRSMDVKSISNSVLMSKAGGSDILINDNSHEL